MLLALHAQSVFQPPPSSCQEPSRWLAAGRIRSGRPALETVIPSCKLHGTQSKRSTKHAATQTQDCSKQSREQRQGRKEVLARQCQLGEPRVVLLAGQLEPNARRAELVFAKLIHDGQSQSGLTHHKPYVKVLSCEDLHSQPRIYSWEV